MESSRVNLINLPHAIWYWDNKNLKKKDSKKNNTEAISIKKRWKKLKSTLVNLTNQHPRKPHLKESKAQVLII